MDGKSLFLGMAGGLAGAYALSRLRQGKRLLPSGRARSGSPNGTQPTVQVQAPDGTWHDVPSQYLPAQSPVANHFEGFLRHGAEKGIEAVMNGIAALFEVEEDQ